MIASVNLDVSIVNVTNESVAGQRRKGRENEREEKREQDAWQEWRQSYRDVREGKGDRKRRECKWRFGLN